MEERKPEPVLPSLLKDWKNRHLIKKQRELEELKFQIEKEKLKQELKKIKEQ